MIDANIWIVVKNTEHKTDPRSATFDYVAEVSDENKFNTMLLKSGCYAYRARSYGKFFPKWDSQYRIKF